MMDGNTRASRPERTSSGELVLDLKAVDECVRIVPVAERRVGRSDPKF